MSGKEQIFGKVNYMIMISGIVLILLGLVIMSMDTEEYGFGALGLDYGPITMMIGFVIEFFAIFYKPKTNE